MNIFPSKLLLKILACGIVLSVPLQGGLIAAQNGNNNGKKQTQTQTQAPAKQSKVDWKEFTSTKSGFSVDLPTDPEHVEQTIQIPKSDLKIVYNTFISEPSEEVVYVISVWDYPAEVDMSKPEVNLQDGFGGMLSALPGSEVLTMRMSEVDDFKALEFLVKNEDIYFQGKLILVHNTLYQVFTVYKQGADMKTAYPKFIDSFKLINPDKREVAPKNGKNGAPAKKMNI